MICCVVGHATLVNSEEDVCHEEGKFLFVPQDELKNFLSYGVTASLFNLKTNILKPSVTTSSASALSETEVVIFCTSCKFYLIVK